MILQALYQLAHAENLAKDLDFQDLPVAWAVMLKEDGALLGIEDRRSIPPAEGKRKSPKPVAPRLRVPLQLKRQGIKAPAYFFVDNAKYVFGCPTSDKTFSAEEGQEKSQWFRERVEECARQTGDTGAEAVACFLRRCAAGTQILPIPEECSSNDLFAFFLYSEPDRPVHLRPAIVEYWRQERQEQPSEAEDAWRCLVTGKPVSEPGLFPQIKRLPGGTPSGVSLVSFNASAFLSQGWKGNENAPISREAAETCAVALQRLLDPEYPDPDQSGATLPARRYRLTSDTTVVYWSPEKDGQETCNMFGALLEPDPAEVGEMYRSIWRGQESEVENPAAFYAMTLSGTQGRVIVRDWLETTVGEVLRNLSAYFADIQVVRNTPKPRMRDHPPALPLNVLLRGLAVNGDTNRLPPNLAAALFHAAVTGTPFPRHVLLRAIERARAEATRNEWLDLERRDARAALVKGYLNRERRHDQAARNRYPEAKKTMDPNNTNTGYLLGRLMALLEKLQTEALGEVNATIVDRYFKRASATPQTVFTHLLKGANSHLKKLRQANRGRAVFFQKQVDNLVDKLPAIPGLPQRLNLEDQGQFLLGYHHQRHWLWMSKETREQWETDQAGELASLETTETE